MLISINKVMKGVSHSKMETLANRFPVGTDVYVLINEEMVKGTIARYPEKEGLFVVVKVGKIKQQLPFNLVYTS